MLKMCNDGRMQKKDFISYWVESSDNDYVAMTHLFEKGDYSWSLFIGHLVVEKLLKAWFVKNISNNPPFVHDLVRLAAKGDLPLAEDQMDLLDAVSTFNIRARYDDYKMEFQKKCNREFAQEWFDKIRGFREWMKKKLGE